MTPTPRLPSVPARGYLTVSKFDPLPLPTMIWLGEHAIVGPFCRHCGNPHYAHGPQGECLNYRIHALLPLGDLPLGNEMKALLREQWRAAHPFLPDDKMPERIRP